MTDGAAPTPNVLPEHVRLIRGIARSLLFDDQEADDAVQDTLLKALEKPPAPGNVRGWLSVVVRNFALRRRREEKRRKKREMRRAAPNHISSPEEVIARLEVQRRVLDAVRELPEPYRSTIVHRYLDELTREEIAARLSIPLETVRTRIKRALRLLRERLGEGDGEAAWVGALLPLFGMRLVSPGDAAVAGGSWLGAKAAAGIAVLGAGALLWFTGRSGEEPSRADFQRTALHASLARDAGGDGGAEESEGEADPAARWATGVVRDVLGAPIAEASVRIADRTELATARDGRFRVRGAADDGRARVTIRKEGYLPLEAVLDTFGPLEHEFTLVRGAPLTVIVLDRAGRPVAGAPVAATLREDRGIAGLWWSRRSVAVGEATSDDQGIARVGAAPPGLLEIRVDDPRYAMWRTEIRVDGTESLRCEALLTTGGVVSGTVRDPAGRPVSGARVYCSSRPGHACLTSEGGTYELSGVVEGENRILAEAENYGTGFFGASLGWGKPVPVRVAEGRTVSGIDIIVPAAVVATGRVLDDRGDPLAGVRVESMVGPCLGRAASSLTGADGRFESGPYATTDGRPIRLAFILDGYAIESAGADLPAQAGPIDLGDIVARRHGTIRGQVMDVGGKPLRRGRVEVVPDGRAVLVGEDGTFVLTGLAPGLIHVQATAPDPLRRSDAVPVKVEPGAEASGTVIELATMRSIRGRVLGAQGAPAAGIVVAAAHEREGEPLLARATTGAAGEFELADLPDGAYRVGILRAPISEETTAPDSRVEFAEDAVSVRLFVPGLDEVEPPPEGTFLAEPPAARARAGREDLVFVLPGRSTAVEGRVVSRATGEPIPGFEVSYIEFWKGLVPKGSETVTVRDANGRFARDLKEGSWAAEISAPGFATVRTPVFEAGERATCSLGTIRVGPGGAMRGTVCDAGGAPVSYARLYLLGPQLQTNRRPIFTDAQGSYEAKTIAPGTYTVFVLSPRHPLGIVRNVEIQEGAFSPLDVRLGRPSPVTVVVTDEEGRPVAGAEVSYTCEALMPLTSRVLRSHEPPGWGGYRTDAQGRLFKPYFPATRVHFRVKASGFSRAARSAELREDRDNVVEVRLERQR